MIFQSSNESRNDLIIKKIVIPFYFVNFTTIMLFICFLIIKGCTFYGHKGFKRK